MSYADKFAQLRDAQRVIAQAPPEMRDRLRQVVAEAEAETPGLYACRWVEDTFYFLAPDRAWAKQFCDRIFQGSAEDFSLDRIEELPVQLEGDVEAGRWGFVVVDIARVHSAIARYQSFLQMVGTVDVRSLAQQIEWVYGPINKPGVEAIALSRILGLRNQDSCEIFRSLVSTEHPIRQAIIEYLGAHAPACGNAEG